MGHYRFRRRGSPWSRQSPPKWGKRRRVSRNWALGLAIAGAMVAGGMAVHLATGGKLPAVPQPAGAILSTVTGDFALCGVSFGRDCVIDGDTIEVNGERIRMLDFDTPEISEPKCASEYAKGQEAKFRLLELLNSGTVQIRSSGARDSDKYGRKLRLVLVDGRSVGDTLIAEGLAWPWEGRRHAWCG